MLLLKKIQTKYLTFLKIFFEQVRKLGDGIRLFLHRATPKLSSSLNG